LIDKRYRHIDYHTGTATGLPALQKRDTIMTASSAIRFFDAIALRVFNTAVLVGLGAVALGLVAQ
jgi:hypothetical protein